MKQNELINIDGEIKTIKEWCSLFNTPIKIFHTRVGTQGWKIEDAIKTSTKRVELDITQKYGKLKPIKVVGISKDNKKLWECKCDCGKITITRSTFIKSGRTKSCGCLEDENRKNMGKRTKTHGMSKTQEYRTWCGIKRRCYDKNNETYCYYGARGITICDRWLEKFENFYQDMGNIPDKEYSLDRINVNGNYEKENCRWATREEQGNNRRNNRKLTCRGKTMTITQWGKLLCIGGSLIHKRLLRNWSIEEAIFTPKGGK